MTDAVPREVSMLFWDVEPGGVDLERHADYVMERVMTRGGLAAMQWLRRTYSTEAMAAFLERKGKRTLAPRDLAYWALVAGVTVSPGRGGGRPPWAGP